MAVAGFLWGALLLVPQARASPVGGASEPASRARLAARGERGGGALSWRGGLEAREGSRPGGLTEEEERWGGKEEKKKKKKREKGRKEKEK
jgi:hypothetical protein